MTMERIEGLWPLKNPKMAILRESIKGRFTRWKEGELVIAAHLRYGQYIIQKLKVKRQGKARMALPMLNQFVGVRKNQLEFR